MIEDRRAWIAEEAQLMAEKLGMKLPKIVFREDKPLGVPAKIRLSCVEVRPRIGPHLGPAPELRISPSSLESDDPGELRYRLALVLIAGDPRRMELLKMQMERLLLPTAFLAAGVGFGVLFLFHWTALAILVGILGCVAASIVQMPGLMNLQLDVPLRAVELTGEVRAALNVMRVDLKRARFLPVFLHKRIAKTWLEHLQKVEAGLESRGLMPVPDDDKTPLPLP